MPSSRSLQKEAKVAAKGCRWRMGLRQKEGGVAGVCQIVHEESVDGTCWWSLKVIAGDTAGRRTRLGAKMASVVGCGG